jgi:hypothetical protein
MRKRTGADVLHDRADSDIDKQSDLAFEIITGKGDGMVSGADQGFQRSERRIRGR